MSFNYIITSWHLYYLTAALLTALLTSSPAAGLLVGLTLTLTLTLTAVNSAPAATRAQVGALGKTLLQVSVGLLGAGLRLDEVLRVGYDSIGVTLSSIALTLAAGLALGRLLRVPRAVSALVSGGTAICGGSAIAALAPTLSATSAETAVAMLVVFALNAAGLLLFPPLGAALGLSEEQFGLWAALAIHDTSSVVGAAAAYGGAALGVATTVKLTRALWILPLSLLSARLHGSSSGARAPWFLLAFLGMALARLLLGEVPLALEGLDLLAAAGRRLMVVTLFCVGASLSAQELRRVGVRPFLLGLLLWALVTAASAWLISAGWLSPLGALGA
jgi:uncharacterized integral membrane protein (TIGR00698 family)